MGRAIEFRCWNSHASEMEPWDKMVEMGKIHLVAKNEHPYKVMQFTGLFDCNGAKIFEGDIVRDHVGVGEVQYSDKKASFKVNYHDGYAKWFIDYNLRGERESIEVIGNIHQNPGLLS